MSSSQRSDGHFAALLSVGTLILGATTVFAALETALETIWQSTRLAPTGIKGWIRARILSVGVILAVGFLLLVSLTISTALASLRTFVLLDETVWAALLAAVDHAPTHRAVAAERSFLAALGGDCRSPVAAHAQWLEGGVLRLDGEIYSDDGADHAAGHVLVGGPDDARALAERLLAGAPATVRRLFGT